MKFNKDKHKALHYAWNNQMCKYKLGNNGLGCSIAARNLGVIMYGKLNKSQQYGLTTKKTQAPNPQANDILGTST